MPGFFTDHFFCSKNVFTLVRSKKSKIIKQTKAHYYE